jgi:hypothetical protein
MSTPVVVEICSWISELLGRAVLAPDGAPSRADGLEKGRHALALRIGPGSGDVQPAVIVRASAQRDRVVSGFRSRGALSASPGSPGSRPPPADKPGEEGVGQVLDAQRTLERVVVGDRHVAHPAQAADAIDTLRLRERLPEAGPAEGVVAAVRREDRMNVEIAARGRRPSDRIHAPGYVPVRTTSTELRPVSPRHHRSFSISHRNGRLFDTIARLRRRSRGACWLRSAQRSCRPRRAWGS